MDKAIEILLNVLRVLLVERAKCPPLSILRTMLVAGRGGLLGSSIVAGLMGWMSPAFSRLDRPLDAAARAMFAGLVIGALGGVAMGFISGHIHRRGLTTRLWWSGLMLIAGGTLLFGAHYLSAEMSKERNPNFEWLAVFAHGGLASLAAVHLIDFRQIPTGLRCLTVAVMSSLIGAVGYAGVTWVGQESGHAFISGRGPFVTVVTVPYVSAILLSLFFARLDWSQVEAIVGGGHS